MVVDKEKCKHSSVEECEGCRLAKEIELKELQGGLHTDEEIEEARQLAHWICQCKMLNELRKEIA